MRCKVLKPKGSVVLRYTSSAKNPFDEQANRVLSQGFPQVLLEYAVVATASATCEVHYDVTRMVALSEHLRKPLDGEALREMLDHLKTLLDTCTALHLPLMNVVFDVNQVYYDSWSRALKFIYLPFAGIAPDARKIQAFFTGLSSRVRPADATAQQLIATYDAYVRAQAAFDPVALCSFLGGIGAKTALGSSGPSHAAPNAGGGELPAQVDSLAGRTIRERPASAAHARTGASASFGTTVLSDLEAEGTRAEKPTRDGGGQAAQGDVRGRHAAVDPGTSVLDGLTWESVSDEERAVICGDFQPEPGPRPDLSATPQSQPAPRPNPVPAPKAEPAPAPKAELVEPAPVPSVPPQAPPAAMRETTVLDEADQPVKRNRFWLTHVRSGDRVELVGSRFVVGKSKFSTYQVRDTTTVSRNHALFCCERDGCWIEDNDSKNGTFVNGQSLAPHARRRLHDGDVIRMSDESFAFVEERAGA